MALCRRGRIWYADYYVGGERVQESTGASNRRDAEKFCAMRVAEVERGACARPLKVSLADFGLRYLDHAKTRKRSWKRDEQMLENLKAFFGPVNIGDISPLRVEQYQQARVREVCPATVNRELALLKHMFNVAERWSLHRSRNPVRLVKFLPEDNLQFQTLSSEEEARLLASCPPYLQDLVLFALNTGLRSGDIFNLKWEEVDLERRALRFLVQKTRRWLEIPLNDVAFKIVHAWSGMRRGSYGDWRPLQGRQERSEGSLREGHSRPSHVAYVPSHLCFAPDAQGSGPGHRERAVGAFDGGRHDAICAHELRGQAAGREAADSDRG